MALNVAAEAKRVVYDDRREDKTHREDIAEDAVAYAYRRGDGNDKRGMRTRYTRGVHEPIDREPTIPNRVQNHLERLCTELGEQCYYEGKLHDLSDRKGNELIYGHTIKLLAKLLQPQRLGSSQLPIEYSIIRSEGTTIIVMSLAFRISNVIGFIALFHLLPTQIGFSQEPVAPVPNVLIIHSYSTDFQWTRDLDASIRDTLMSGMENNVSVQSEFLDMKRYTSADYLDAAARFLATKHAGRSFELLIVTDNLGLSFLTRYRDAVFGPVPTVFTGINDFQEELVGELENVTGVAEDLSIRETIAFAMQTMPGDTVAIVGDGTVTTERNISVVRAALTALDWDGSVQTYNPLSSDQLSLLSRTIEPTDIVLLVGSILDSNGDLIDFSVAGSLVAAASPAPVFSFWDFYNGTGIVGGKMASGVVQGSTAADLGVEILNGRRIETIPIVRESPNRWIFDADAMQRSVVADWPIPSGAVVLNDRITLWKNFRVETLSTIIMFVVLLTLLALLVVNVRNRTIAGRKLHESLREKEVLLKEIHHRVKNNLQVVSSILNMQGELLSDTTAYSYFKDCETRIHSMALVHEQLYQSSTLSHIEMSNYIEELMSDLTSAMGDSSDAIQIVQRLDSFSLNLDQAIPIGLIINELVSNALKYAYPNDGGTIEIETRWMNPAYEITVRDYGVGYDPTLANHHSLGIQLVHALASQLDGTVTFTNSEPGLTVRLSVGAVLAEA